MGRKNRNYNGSRYFHVLSRGVGKHIIFEDDADRKYFIKLIHEFSIRYDVEICAYCLMENHYHMLVYLKDEKKSDITSFMHKLGTKYAIYYNAKYDHVGHLFQGRFQSKPIEDESYFLTVFRYIIRNAENAGLCSTSQYKWHSLYDMLGVNRFCNISMAVNLAGGITKLRDFVLTSNNDKCYDFDNKLSLEEAKMFFRATLQKEGVSDLATLSKDKRDELLINFVDYGLTYRQLERLTGISRSTISRIVQNNE